MTVDSKGIHAIEILNRPPRTWGQMAHAMIFFIVFNFGCIMVNASQFVFLLPLRFLPLVSAKSLYSTGIRLSKGAFGTLLSKSPSTGLPLARSYYVYCSPHESMVRTFTSRHNLRTRRPWRLFNR